MEDAKAPWVYKVLCTPGVGFMRGRGRIYKAWGRVQGGGEEIIQLYRISICSF